MESIGFVWCEGIQFLRFAQCAERRKGQHLCLAVHAGARLIDMGAEPFLVSSSIIGVLAQRLVRKICPDCKEKYAPTKETLKDIGLTPDEKMDFYRGKGCAKCLKTGYKGRVSIYELMVPDNKIHDAIVAKLATEEIRKLALASGMISLMEDGLQKIKEGMTTPEEVLRVTQEE